MEERIRKAKEIARSDLLGAEWNRLVGRLDQARAEVECQNDKIGVRDARIANLLRVCRQAHAAMEKAIEAMEWTQPIVSEYTEAMLTLEAIIEIAQST